MEISNNCFHVIIMSCSIFGWSVCGRSAGLLLCFITVLFQVLFGGWVSDTGNVTLRASMAFTCLILRISYC
jgi:hypothetical protein